MRRYLRAAGIGELLGLFFWFLVCFMFGTGGYNSDTEWLWSARLPVKLFDSPKLYEYTALEEKARMLLLQLDAVEHCVPFLVGFPAIAVLSLWTFDRRRKQNTST
jgi:hypothetical protein